MKKRIEEEKEIIDLLTRDPKEGMVLLVERYTGLIWKIVSLYLSNIEDIKECTNDTFAEFYFQRKRFDPAKAGLQVYLAAIARNQAISCYRKEKKRRMEALDEATGVIDEQMELAELRADLQEAMKVLRPDESKIIRMKYYEGMTVREIADSLDIPYETVKKRHQRSLGKLRHQMMLLLILLCLLLITACSYRLLVEYQLIPDYLRIWFQGESEDDEEEDPDIRPLLIQNPDEKSSEEEGDHSESEEIPTILIAGDESGQKEEKEKGSSIIPRFTYAPGYGVNWEPGSPFYTFQQARMIENEWVTFEMTDAAYVNHTLRLVLVCTSKEASIHDLISSGKLTGNTPDLTSGNSRWKASYSSSYLLNDYQQQIEFYYRNIELPDTNGEAITLSLSPVYGISDPLIFSMTPAQEEETSEYAYQMEEYGGLLAIPRLEDGSLIVEIYPVDADDAFQILPELIRGRWGEQEGGQVTVTGVDGTEKTGRCVNYRPSLDVDYFEWDFGPAEPGEYTLHVPYVYQTAAFPEEFEIPVNLAEKTWDEASYELPEGSLTIESCEDSTSGDGRAAWKIQMKYQSDNPGRTISQVYFYYKCKEREDYVQEEYPPGSIVYEQPKIDCNVLEVNGENGIISSEVLVNTDRYDASDFRITAPISSASGRPAGVTYRWNQSFDLTFTVEDSE